MVVLENEKSVAGNRLLERLEAGAIDRLRPLLQPVQLDYDKVLYEAGSAIEFVYFPLSGVTSLVKTMEDGGGAEVGTVGNEGMVGVPVLFGGDASPTTVHVEVPGDGLRMPARPFRDLLSRDRGMQEVMQRYAYALFNQISQIVACNLFHEVEQRCARWLLMAQDRMPGNDFMLTHEVLSLMLGVRRSSVTVAAGKLSEAGLIEYRRGHVTILDRPGLKRRSCECYHSIQQEYDRLLGHGG